MQTIRLLVTLAVFALSSNAVSAATDETTPAPTTAMTTPGPTTAQTTPAPSSKTIFLGTEYDPEKCSLQLASLECLTTDKKDICGDINGYPLECVNLGRLNGKDKYACQCRANETDVCQGSTAPTISGAFQFDSCSDEKQCADTYGHVPSKKELRICAEKLHCVKEVNTTASQPAQICHTCRSCISQNDAAGAQLADKRRFDCTKICPKSILDSLAARNDQGVGIADEVTSEEDSGWGSGSDDSTGGEDDASATGSASAEASKSDAVSSSALAATIVFTALSVVLLH